MRKQTKRAALIAQRNTMALRKGAKVKVAVSSASLDKPGSPTRFTSLKDKKQRRLRHRDSNHANGPSCNDDSSCVDTFVSDLTPSSSTLDLHSLGSETMYTQEDEDDQSDIDLFQEQTERPMVVNFQSKDILRIMSELKTDFKDANRDDDGTLLHPVLQDLKSMFLNTSSGNNKGDKELNTRLDIANNFLRSGDFYKANIQYQVSF